MSDPAQREETIFTAALKLAAGQRDAYLQEVCGGDAQLRARVEGLLRARGQPIDSDKTMVVSVPLTEKPGDKIGRYKLLEQIGEGGFGVVYVAAQEEPVRRRVALKVIKMGMDTKQVIARFEAERQALALMDHPNIAKVLDAGATNSGRPYFVMELVKGDRITDYCDKNNLTTRERLDLFVQICHAIQHAHQKGIIHRDIKPSNILVAMHDGVAVPKVIDFGIAKATEQRLTDKTVYTALEQMIGTPAYMSPEQAEMSGIDIDTRSDIYSLGVLLYELLTGKTPFDPHELVASGLEAMRRTIREQEPQRPSTRLTTMVEGELTATAKRRQTDAPKLIHSVRGDLDWIVMKCLEKNRTRRYETANGLASDILRHVNNEAVLARPPSQVYRFQKLVQRNKLVCAAACAIAAALAVGVTLSVWGLVKEHQSRLQAERNEQRAEAEAAKSRQVAQFLKDMLNGVGPSVALGRDTTLLREVLDKTVQRVGTDLAKQPEVEAELRYTLGEVYWELGDLENAEAMHRAALSIRLKVLGDKNPQVAQSMRSLGHVLWRRGRLDEAEKMAHGGMAMQRELFSSRNLEVAGSLEDLAAILNTENKMDEAETVLRESLAIREALLGHDNLEVADTLDDLAGLLSVRRGKGAEAETPYREALAIKKKVLGADNPLVIIASLKFQGIELESQGKLGEAETTLNELVTAQRKLLGNEHPDLAQSLNRLAAVLKKEGKLAESESIRREALAMQRKLLGDKNDEVAQTLSNLGSVLASENKLPEAESMCREALMTRRKVFGNHSAKVGRAVVLLGGILEKEGKLEEAKNLYLEAATGTNGAAATTQNHLGDMYQNGQGVEKDNAEAVKWFRKAAEQGSSDGQNKLGWMYEHGAGVEKDYAAAIKWYRKAAEQNDPAGQEHVARMYENGRGVKQDHAEAVKWYRKAAEQGRADDELRLGDMYENGWEVKQDYAEAIRWYRKAAEQGNSQGQFRLGWIYANGRGVEKDYAEAVTRYRKAADQSADYAQVQLGQMYESGQGVAKDLTEAARWYHKAAQRGNKYAMIRLARMYQRGKGVPKDDSESAKWYLAVREQGDAQTLNDFAWELATGTTAEDRDGTNAVRFAEKAVAATSRTNAEFLDTLAAAYAETHQFGKAVAVQQEAMGLPQSEQEKKDFGTRLKLYQSNTPYRDRGNP